MKTFRRALPSSALALCLAASQPFSAHAQTVNASQQITLQGLRTAGTHGSFPAAKVAPDSSLILLYDQKDGIRLLKTDATATTVLAQQQTGAAGDSALALALDPTGNIYLTGTTTSATLTGTSGTAFPTRADASTNSFLAKYDSNLNLLWLTFLGSGRTAAAAVAATADAVFVTGITFNPAFPVTPAGIQQTPATGSSTNGFVERFSPDGKTLVYATYLTGANGDTNPTAVAADATDNAYITGSTTATGFPTTASLQPRLITNPSGFLTRLTPAGDGFTFSTFISGTGLTGLALDATTNTLVFSGNLAFGQFPIATVTAPLAATPYQSVLRLPLDGQSITSSIALAPGTQSFATPAASGAWISGQLTTPLFPAAPPPDYSSGDSFLFHLTSTNAVDQTLRFGGQPVNNPTYASLISTTAAPAVSASGTTITLPATLTATVAASLLSTERFDLPLTTPTAALPNQLRDAIPTACGQQSQCTATAGLLAQVSTTNAAALSLSTDALPNLTLRNQGSAAATGLALTATGYTLTTNCTTTLAPSNQCTIALTGSGPGTLTASAANAPTLATTLAATTAPATPLTFSTNELDFGIQTATSTTATRTLTITNLSNTTQTFTSTKDGGGTTPYTFTESATTCGSAPNHTLAANATCTLTFALTVSSNSANDGPIAQPWKLGTTDILLTAFAQAASLSLSSTAVDFGAQFNGTNAIHLPRFLYLSNNSTTSITHTAAALPASSPFTITDACPATLAPHSVCRLTITYASPTAPSQDAATLTLDNLSVLITGQTLAAATANASAANPNLTGTPAGLTFTTPVIVTNLSAAQTVTLRNTGATAIPLSFTLSGDFQLTNGCGAALAATSSCTLSLTFAPSQPGTRDGLLSIATGSSFTPTYIALTGSALPLLPANNGTLNLGQTLVGEPAVAWYKIQQSVTSLTATTGAAQFGVALAPDTGTVPTTLAPSAFNQTVSGPCNNCYLGIQFLSQTAGPQATTLTLSTVPNANPNISTLTATALPVTGLLLTPITPDFGTATINSSTAPIAFTLTNLLAPATAIVIQSITTTGDFTLAATNTGNTCNTSLAATASCSVPVLFAPTAQGQRTGTLTITTSGGTASAALTGYAAPDPGLSLTPNSLTFSNVPGTAATRQTITLKNTSTASITFDSPTVSSTAFNLTTTCGNLAPGASCSLTVTFTPQTAPVTATISLPASSTQNGQFIATVYTIPLNATYTAEDAGLQVLPAEVNFGSTPNSTLGPTRQLTLNNLTAKTLAISLQLPRNFPLASANQCATLAPNATCNLSVSFLPAEAGALTGSLLITGAPTDGSAPVQALDYLLGYGTGTAALTITGLPIPNTPLSFGQVSSGQTVAKTLTLTNSGTTPLTVRRLFAEPPFYSTSTCATTLVPNATCTVTLTYAPIDQVTTATTTRADAGTLTIESDSTSSPDFITLSGLAAPLVTATPISSAVLNTFTLSESALTFPNTQIGNASTAQQITLTNTGSTTLHVFALSAPADFTTTTTCATLLPGATCTLTITFTPTSSTASTTRAGTLEILSDSGTSLEFITLLGPSSAAPLTLSPTALDFGTLNVGSSSTLPITVTNNTAAPIAFKSLTAAGDYTAAPNTCPASNATLAAGATCTLNVTFTPIAAGTRTGTLSLTTDATTLPLTASLTGNAVTAHLQITPGALAFGSISVGASAPLSLTLLNTGTAAVNSIAAAITGADAADFAVTAPCSTSSLAPNQGCTATVTFTPSATGPRTATLAIASSDPTSPTLIPLTGTGVAAGTFTLTTSTPGLTIKSGTPAVYSLTLTPLNSFTGTVALTCTALTVAPNATCSLQPSTLTLGAAQTFSVTINTITSSGHTQLASLAWLLFAPLLLLTRRRTPARSNLITALLLSTAAATCLSLTACGGAAPAAKSNLLYTPAGSYQYQVTASSTTGIPTTSSVTLTLTVQ